MKPDISTTTDPSVLQMYLDNAVTIATKEKEAKEKVIEKVIEATSSTTVAVSPTARGRRMRAALSAQSQIIVNKTAPIGAAPLKDDSYLPIPDNLPPSNSPDFNGDDTDYTGDNLEGQMNDMMIYFEDVGPGAADFQKIMNLISEGKATPSILAKLDKFMKFKDNGISMWASMVSQYAYFGGYQGVKGADGMHNYLTALISHLQQGTHDPAGFVDKAIQVLQKLNTKASIHEFNLKHLGANGDHIWTYDGKTYDWDNPTSDSDSENDVDMIMKLINAQMPKEGVLNPFITGMNVNGYELSYRQEAISDLVSKYKNEPALLLYLLIGMVEDNHYEGDITRQTKDNDGLTTASSSVDEMMDAVTAFTGGTGTDADTTALINGLFSGKLTFDTTTDFSDIGSTFKKMVFDAFMGFSVPQQSGSQQITIGDAVKDFLAGKPIPGYNSLTDVFNTTMESTPPSGGIPVPPVGPGPAPAIPPYTPNPIAQQVGSVMNQFANIVNGKSKAVGVVMQNDISILSAAEKAVNDGITQMQKSIKISLDAETTS